MKEEAGDKKLSEAVAEACTHRFLKEMDIVCD
jgi:hypothetical protein